MSERTYWTDEQLGAFDSAYRRLQQVFADLEYGHAFNDSSKVFQEAMIDLGRVRYGTEIPEGPEPNREGPSSP